jgi:hypothetical protein
MGELYLHFPIRLYGVLDYLSTGTTLPLSPPVYKPGVFLLDATCSVCYERGSHNFHKALDATKNRRRYHGCISQHPRLEIDVVSDIHCLLIHLAHLF